MSPALLARAREIVGGYRYVLEPRPSLGFLGYTVELSGVMAGGKTPDACMKAAMEAQAGAVAAMLESGEAPPAPASERKRQAQINIRVTDDEKLVLETTAQRMGFRNVSEFMRIAALNAARAA